MSQLTDQFIEIICKPVSKRHESEIEAVISWLRRRVQILRNIDKRDVVKIVKNCTFQMAAKDDIIIQQGDIGDSMFVILRGSTLVYIDTYMTGEEDPTLPSPIASPTRDPETSPDVKKKFKISDRSVYGKYIMRYETGKSFGEPALLSDDHIRNATILAEEDCDLMVIDQDIFDTCLKAQQELEFAEIENFVEGHPYFCHMSPKFKRLLELSLRKDSYPFDSDIVRQGDPVTSLYFILVGQANMYVEPGAYQRQYAQMWPFEAGTDLYAQEFEWLRESRKNAILRKYEDPAVWPTKSEHLVVKRTEGYAAVEKRVQEKSVCLCSIHTGEVIGDVEVVQKLGTYMSTVTCVSATTAFVLDLKNLERLVGRRNQVTMEVMKEKAKEKLEMRTNSRQGKDITFLNYLLIKIKEERLPSAKKLPPIKVTKQLPAKDYQIQHLIERFKEGQAQLIEPRVPGALIYKEQMQEKARIRAKIRLRGTGGISAMLREARRQMNRRQPRSRREIVESLKEMMESELVEYASPRSVIENKVTDKKRSRGKQTTKAPTPTSSSLSDSGRKKSTGDASKNVRFEEPVRRDSLDQVRRNSQGEVRRRSSEDLTKVSPLSTRPDRKKSLPQASEKPSLNLPAIVEKREPSNLTVSSREMSAVDKGQSEQTDAPKVLKEESSVPQGDLRSAVSSGSSKPEYQRREVAATSNSPTRLPPLAKPELKKPESLSPSKWETALKFVNERINDRFTHQLMSRGNGFDDYETSDLSLNVLEKRIKSFFVKNAQLTNPSQNVDKQDLKLPKLPRFKVNLEDTSTSLPKPGGKVWIRKRLCRFANSSVKVKNHEHVRYHMVPELPQFDSVKKTKVIMHQLFSGAMSDSKTDSPSANNMMAMSSTNQF